MSAAVFVLAINLFVAFIFASAFGLAAIYARSAHGARWLALSYAVGMLNPLLEFALPHQQDGRLVQVAIAMSFLGAMAMGVVGLAQHYRLGPPRRLIGLFLAFALAVNVAVLDMDRSEMLRNVLYQLPYFLVQVLAVVTILRYRKRQILDDALVSLFTLSALQFLLKPFLAAALGNGSRAQDYIGSTYAAVSQSVGAMLLIATGLLLLLIILRDVMAEMTARSETDTLSGLLNRRGFDDRADRLLAGALRNRESCAVIVADLDHFKAINDSYGHEAGDQVIRAFAGLLTLMARPDAIIGRLGGEEFAIFLPRTGFDAAFDCAESVRSAFAALSVIDRDPGRRFSASFGVAALQPGDTLSDMLRRADAALYEAKTMGRDQVRGAQAPV